MNFTSHGLSLTGLSVDLMFLVCFSAAALIPFATYICLWLLGVESLPTAKEEGSGRRLLGPLFVGFYYWLLSPFLSLAKRSGLTPNQFTLASLVASIPTGVAIASGHFALAAVLLIIGNTLDVVDGHLARSKGLASKAGAFLDSTVDRVCDGMILGGFAVYYAGTPTMFAALTALIMSFATSYARARGEALGISGSGGLLQRADRLVILALALALSPYLGHRAEGFVPHPTFAVAQAALWLLAALSSFTAASRVLWIMKKLRPKAAATAIASPSPLSVRTIHPLLSSAITPVHSMAARDAPKTPTGSADAYRR
ncbi:MAG TPA: CDP-alcohol phosphatidyltransferase family protein [Polyangia bacterium]